MPDQGRRDFPRLMMLASGEVVPADALLPTAAAFLDHMPAGERVSAMELGDGISISIDRAEAILAQLDALGHTGFLADDGERMIFDPDGPTDPTPLDAG